MQLRPSIPSYRLLCVYAEGASLCSPEHLGNIETASKRCSGVGGTRASFRDYGGKSVFVWDIVPPIQHPFFVPAEVFWWFGSFFDAHFEEPANVECATLPLGLRSDCSKRERV